MADNAEGAPPVDFFLVKFFHSMILPPFQALVRLSFAPRSRHSMGRMKIGFLSIDHRRRAMRPGPPALQDVQAHRREQETIEPFHFHMLYIDYVSLMHHRRGK